MENNIVDITPEHAPAALAKAMLRRAPGAAAGCVVLVKEDGSIWYDMAGHKRIHVLWALQRMIHLLMEE